MMSDTETDTSCEDDQKPEEDHDDASSESAVEEDRPGPKKHETEDKTADEKESVNEEMAAAPSTSTSITTLPPKPRRKRFIPKYEVEGVYKLILSEETQLQIEMVIGSHINSQYPWKTVEKEKIIENIENCGEVSEFYHIRDQIKEYPEHLILMGYIPDESKDEDEFYICVTIEARDYCKQQSDKFIRRQEKKLLKAVQKKPRPWECLGSDIEIIALEPTTSRELKEIELKSPFPRPYQPMKFSVRDTNSCRDGLIELIATRQKFSNVFQRRIDVGIQSAASKCDRYAQTDLKYPKNMWTQSIADAMGMVDIGGGGDTVVKKRKRKQSILDYDDDDEDETESESDDDDEEMDDKDDVALAAFKRAFGRMRRASYLKSLDNFTKSWEDEYTSVLELNTIMDMYCNDYQYLEKKRKDKYATMTFEEYVCFTDVRAKDKYISCATFHPMWSGIVAISYADSSPNVMKSLSTRPDPIRRAVYGLNPVMIWSHIDSLYPKLYLSCTREVKSLAFCPYDENILVGGCVNGQVVIWDLKNKLEKVETIEVLGETRERYRIAMNAHMGWMKPVQDNAVVPATAMSNLAVSHNGAINSIRWFNPNFDMSTTGQIIPIEKTNFSQIFFTGADDGTILIWDMNITHVTFTEGKKFKRSRRVLKRPSGLMVDYSPYKILDRNLCPIYRLIIGAPGKAGTFHLQTMSMDFPMIEYIHTPRDDGKGRKYFRCEVPPQQEDDLQKTMFCGSQHGEFRCFNWVGNAFNTGETINTEYTNIKYTSQIHDGIVYSTARNPFMSDVILSVGGKVFAIWIEAFQGRPLIWKKRLCRLTDGVWSLYKPSLFFISTSDGNVETWDLLLKSDEAIAIQTVSGYMLTGLTVHSLPLSKNIIGVSDQCGAFNMFINPPIFQLSKPKHLNRMRKNLDRELKVMNSFMAWQDEWMKNNAQKLLEMKRKEALLLLEKEEEKKKLREEEETRLEEEAEARRIARMRVIGPEERWQRIVQKLIEQTIAAKKRIDRDALIEDVKPLVEIEQQRLEKEKRMHDILKHQKAIFNDTVAILFPEAIPKPPKPKKVYLPGDKEVLKKEYLEDYESLNIQALKTVRDNPFRATFSWLDTLAEGKERREALNSDYEIINIHRARIDRSTMAMPARHVATPKQFDSADKIEEDRSEGSEEGGGASVHS